MSAGRFRTAVEGKGGEGGELAAVQQQVLDTARASGYQGYSKHDALNAPWLEKVVGNSRIMRMGFIQLVMRSPVHVRPTIGVRTAS